MFSLSLILYLAFFPMQLKITGFLWGKIPPYFRSVGAFKQSLEASPHAVL